MVKVLAVVSNSGRMSNHYLTDTELHSINTPEDFAFTHTEHMLHWWLTP